MKPVKISVFGNIAREIEIQFGLEQCDDEIEVVRNVVFSKISAGGRNRIDVEIY